MTIDPLVLLQAYAIGVFPMSDDREAEEVYWIEPKRRAIMPLDGFHISHSLAKTIRRDQFRVTANRDFAGIVQLCAEAAPDRPSTWINHPIERAYRHLHEIGFAHSVEVWEGEELVGGLYGVALGRAFFGESMVSRRTDASKVALAWLVARLRVGGYRLLDCQFMTDHLRSLGAIEIDQKRYVAILSSALSAGSFGAGAGAASGTRSAAPAEFGALDRLLAADPARSADGAATGCVIAQLLGHTS
jgi:leucyl/phenylalanyl-tRNA--protein transferase